VTVLKPGAVLNVFLKLSCLLGTNSNAKSILEIFNASVIFY